MEFVWNSNLYSDITFIVGEKKTEMTASSFILSISSHVFAKMFNTDLNNEKIVKIPDAVPDDFLQFLQFINTENGVLSPVNVTGIMYLAKKYSIPFIEKRCNEFAKTNLCVNNVAEINLFADLFEDKTLKEECIELIMYHTAEILNSKNFLFSDDKVGSDKLLKTILSTNTLSCSEIELCQLTLKYGSANHTIIDGKTIREKLGEAFNLIRFLTIKSEDFLETVFKYKDMFSQDEIISVVMKLCLKKNFLANDFASDVRNVVPSIISRSLQTINLYSCIPSYTMDVYKDKTDWKILQFSVNKAIWICKVMVFGKKDYSPTKVILKIKDADDNVIAEQNGFNELANLTSFDICLQRPIGIKSNYLYTICILYVDPGCYYYGTNNVHGHRHSSYGCESQNDCCKTMQVSDVKFEFKEGAKSVQSLYFKIK